MLGGAISPEVSTARNDVALNEAAERMTALVELARRYPDARIVCSPAAARRCSSARRRRRSSRCGCCEIARHCRASAILVEEQSRNTVENAVFSKLIAQPKPGERWLLVTSAYHMPRSIGVFRAAGFPVEAYPVDWRTRGIADALRPFPTLAEGLRRTDTAVREWIGLVAYWLTGRSSELFPRPD